MYPGRDIDETTDREVGNGWANTKSRSLPGLQDPENHARFFSTLLASLVLPPSTIPDPPQTSRHKSLYWLIFSEYLFRTNFLLTGGNVYFSTHYWQSLNNPLASSCIKLRTRWRSPSFRPWYTIYYIDSIPLLLYPINLNFFKYLLQIIVKISQLRGQNLHI